MLVGADAVLKNTCTFYGASKIKEPFYFPLLSFILPSLIYSYAEDVLECRCPPLQIGEM